MIVLIVVLLVAIAVLGTVLVMNKKNGAEAETSTVSQTEMVTSAETSTVAQRTETAGSSSLVYPSSGDRVAPFEATVVCNERNQKFLKMRCGPSKSGYDTVKDRNGNEIHIPNYTVVTIESGPVSRGGVSWSFAAYTYQGQTYHGWIRTDFIP
ncbi:MAG: hypothetical protein IJ133_05815 [Clostridia bacterium]|nr:hypothetical protein [Clostridia bacterium]